MSTNSARPTALDHAAAGLRSSGNRLHEAARAAWAAADAYAVHCSAVPLALPSTSRAGTTVADARDLSSDLFRVAAAFRAADGSGRFATWAAGVTGISDVALSQTILLHHPSLAGRLTEPTRSLSRRGAALGARIADAAPRHGAERALALLRDTPADLLSDPVFAAAVVNGMGHRGLESITEELAARAVDWKLRFGPLSPLADLWTTATRSLDLPPRLGRLDLDLVDSLLATAGGRNVARALSGHSTVSPGIRFARLAVRSLLDRGALGDASLSNTYRFLRGSGAEGHPDAAIIDAVSRVPTVAVELFLDSPALRAGEGDVSARTTRLLDMGPGSHEAVAALLTQVLGHERFDLTTQSRDRIAVLRATYAWLDRTGPDAVTEPLAQFVAGTIATDIDFYLGRVDTARRGGLARVLQGVTEFERPWMTAILAFESHGVRLVERSLHGSADAHAAALGPISRLEDAFEVAAAASDRPLDRASGMFTALSTVADVSLGSLRLHPAAALVAKPVVQHALTSWHDWATDPPDDHEAQTRLAREGLRRRIWAVVASDPQFGQQIDWTVGGTGPDRNDTLGSRVTSVEALVSLTPSDADLDELAGWAAAQPDHLQALVEAYISGAA